MKITSAVNEAHATPRWLPSENSDRLSNCPNQTSGIMKEAKINAEYAAASGLSLIVGSIRKKVPEPFFSIVPLIRTITKKPREIEANQNEKNALPIDSRTQSTTTLSHFVRLPARMRKPRLTHLGLN